MPSLYEYTTPVGDVASGDFTTLYNASGLTVPNAGAGSVSGNLNVGGNLTVQGSSLLIGPVALQSTLSLPSYTFPTGDGTTYQVLTTDGSGNLTWSSVQTLPGANYTISASSTTGGANLDLVSGVTTDSVKFAEGTNITITRTDANTITIGTVADNIPDGTANGQVLVWENSAWTASNIVSATTSALLTAQFKSNSTTTASSFAIRRNTGSTAYASGTSASLIAQVDSDSQAVASYAALGFGYDATNPSFGVRTSTNNFSTNTQILAADSTELVINGTNITLNNNLTGAPTNNATITVNRGSSTDATITWDETDDRWELNYDLIAPGLQGGNVQIGLGSDNQIYIGGNDLQIDTDGSHVVQSNSPIQTTAESMTINSDSTAADSYLYMKGTSQYLKWNNTLDRFEFNNDIYGSGILAIDGDALYINSDSSAVDSYLYMKGSTEYLKWNNTDTRFELSDQLFNSQTDIPVYLERQVTAASVNPRESAVALNLVERVTDAGSNATDDAGPSIQFCRTSGTSPSSTVAKFANIGANYFGTTNTAEFLFNWSNDNYANPSTYPGTYSLLRLGSNDSAFLHNSIFVNYSAQGLATDTATSITGGNTLVFGSAHGYTANQRIKFTSTTQNGLTQNAYYYVLSSGLTATQCQLGLTVSSSPVALTNGTGLTLVFANLVNFVGINTGSPAYTLDVDGDARVTGDVITDGITAGNITVGVVTDNEISTTSGDLTIVPATGSTVTIASAGATDPVIVARVTSNTNTATRGAILRANSTGTPAVGFGVGLDFEVETAVSTFTSGGNIKVVATDITPASEDFKMEFSLTANGTQSVVATLDNSGTLELDGNIQLDGNQIKSSTGATAIGLSGDDVAVVGDLSVHGLSTDAIIIIGSTSSLRTLQTTTTSTSTVAIATTTRNSMSGSVTITDTVTSALHTVNFTALRNGATAMLTTYGELYTAAALAAFTADISGSNLRLLATPASANSTTFNAVRTAIS